MNRLPLEEAYSFDDVLVQPNYSDVLPSDVSTVTQLSRNITLNIPIVSAAMDTVTEARTAISMARAGGIGFIHRNLPIENQAMEVNRVKKSESGMIIDPVTVKPDAPISEVQKLMSHYRISGVPVTDGEQLVGIVTNRDLRFETDLTRKVSEVMTSKDLITTPEGISLEDCKKMLHQHRIEKLLMVNSEGKLSGIITTKDIEKIKKYPNAHELLWCQDEPQNQGAWFFVQHSIFENMSAGQKLGYSGRAASASPAVGYAHLHLEQQKALVDGAFARIKGFVLTR